MEELAKFAQQYLKALGLKLSDLNKKTSETSKEELKMNIPEVNNVCFHCKKPGHRAFECRQQKNNFNRNNSDKKCFNCGKYGHLSKDCRLKPIKMANTLQVEDGNTDNDEEKTNMSCAVKINQETIPRID